MTPEKLKELIEAGEALTVEFKGEEKGESSDRDLIEAVVCLANRPGSESAWLLIGVEKDGRVTGARPRDKATGRTDPARVAALISSRTRPSLSPRVELVPIDESEILVIEVPVSHVPMGTADGIYKRRGIGGDGKPTCMPFHYIELQARQADRGLLDYSALAVQELAWDDLDPLEFERFRRSVRERRGRSDETLLDLPDVELATVLGAVEADGRATTVRVLGLLLFGKEEALRRYLPAHEAAFQVCEGRTWRSTISTIGRCSARWRSSKGVSVHAARSRNSWSGC